MCLGQVCLSQQIFTVLCVYHKTRYSPSALGVIDPDQGVVSELSRHNGSVFEMSETVRIRNCLLNTHCWVLSGKNGINGANKGQNTPMCECLFITQNM